MVLTQPSAQRFDLFKFQFAIRSDAGAEIKELFAVRGF
jgi:hypothetical protein